MLVDELGGILITPVDARAPSFLAMALEETIILDAASRGSLRDLKGVVPVWASRPLTVTVNQR